MGLGQGSTAQAWVEGPLRRPGLRVHCAGLGRGSTARAWVEGPLRGPGSTHVVHPHVVVRPRVRSGAALLTPKVHTRRVYTCSGPGLHTHRGSVWIHVARSHLIIARVLRMATLDFRCRVDLLLRKLTKNNPSSSMNFILKILFARFKVRLFRVAARATIMVAAPWQRTSPRSLATHVTPLPGNARVRQFLCHSQQEMGAKHKQTAKPLGVPRK